VGGVEGGKGERTEESREKPERGGHALLAALRANVQAHPAGGDAAGVRGRTHGGVGAEAISRDVVTG